MGTSTATRSTVTDVQVQETKPGPQTTEFWLAIFGNAIGIAQLTGVWEYLPSGQNRWVLMAIAIINALYAVGRGQAKSGVGFLTAERRR
jgi:hypothetical protein